MARVKAPTLPDAREPLNDIIAHRVRRFEREAARRRAERWHPITLAESGPFGAMFFGDPHLDDNGCNWPLLLRHVELCRRPGVYGVCVGDKSNNWVGRLVREYADQETAKSDARRLVSWFLRDAGINWAFCVMGNHDVWNEGDAILGLIADQATYFPHWEARVELRAAGAAFRVHCRHDFPGSSIYNKTHGPSRAALFGGEAELYVCGHRHTFATQSFEQEESGRLVHAVRARGYKEADTYATVCGFAQGQAGASVFVLFNPAAETPAGRITTFADPALGVQVLEALRSKGGRQNAEGRRGRQSRPAKARRR